MGNSLACCGKSESDPNNINTDLGREYNSGAKLRAIIKIQARFRGFLARKYVRQLKEQSGVKSMMNLNNNFSGPANYDNPEVQVRN